MSEKKDERALHRSEKGRPEEVSFVLSPALVSDIVRREVLNSPGVTGIGSASFIGRGKGITVSEETRAAGEVSYKVEVHLYVEYGTNCPKLKDALAQRIAATVRKMTGREVLSLVVHVEGVREPVPPAEEELEENPEAPLVGY